MRSPACGSMCLQAIFSSRTCRNGLKHRSASRRGRSIVGCVHKRGPVLCVLDYHPESVVLSASPERFLRVDVEGHVETRPIKGTRPRGLGPEHDAALGVVLTKRQGPGREPDDRRPDAKRSLARLLTRDRMRVSELFALEHYATVHHLVSTVVGQLAPGRDALDLLLAAFQAARSGRAQTAGDGDHCRARTLTARNCGSVGYHGLTGALDTSIAIRTALALRDRVYFSAGGGIVADSDPQQEYLETLDKARGLIDALAPPS